MAVPEGKDNFLLIFLGVLGPPGNFGVIVCLGERVSIVPLAWFAAVLALHLKGVRSVEIIGEDEFSFSDKSAFLDAEQPCVIESMDLDVGGGVIGKIVFLGSDLIVREIDEFDLLFRNI